MRKLLVAAAAASLLTSGAAMAAGDAAAGKAKQAYALLATVPMVTAWFPCTPAWLANTLNT